MIFGFFKMDLQNFADEKTEKATPKRRKETREKGQVVRSGEVNSALLLMAVFGGLKLFFPHMIRYLMQAYNEFITMGNNVHSLYTQRGIQELWLSIIKVAIIILGPILGCSLIAGLVINYGQVGFLFTSKALSPRFNRINPVEGFKRIFSKRALYELLKSMLKFGAIGSIFYSEITSNLKGIITGLMHMDLIQGSALVGEMALSIAFKALLALMVLAVFDYIYQWWEHEKSIRMSKQEIKEEYKQTEGNPQIRSQIRAKQRQLGMRRMMQDLSKADVVITNPTHFAIALQYDPQEHDAPFVVAKGRDLLALRIKEIAKENQITIVENKPLAQALYRSVEVGQTIPQELFYAVAEVLAFVYNMKGRNY